MKFEKYTFSPEIHRSLQEAGFRRTTDIQFKSIPAILQGNDVLAIAQTGTGKTAAFAIPIIEMLHTRKTSSRSSGIRCLVMAPTRELAMQISEVFSSLGKHSRVKSFCVTGGTDQDPQISRLQSGIDILIATPGRLFDLASQQHLDLSKVEILVLDEADHMLDLGFIKDIRDLVKKLPRKRQTLFFSATIDVEIKKLAYSLVINPIRIQISPDDPVAKNIEHAVAMIEMDDKRFFLERLVNEHQGKKILVFVRTKVRAERVRTSLEKLGIASETLHSDIDQNARFDIMKRFKQGDFNLMIATDISARGIDIPNVDYVVNYDMPEKAENYVHRVGRTGRGVLKGNAVSFCSNDEKPLLEAIEAYTGKAISRMPIGRKDYDETIAASQESHSDWKTLLREAEALNVKVKRGKARKK